MEEVRPRRGVRDSLKTLVSPTLRCAILAGNLKCKCKFQEVGQAHGGEAYHILLSPPTDSMSIGGCTLRKTKGKEGEGDGANKSPP